ncbi:HAMP domain-containing protein [Alteromonas sp. SM 2104]|nr:HAMP domain-containing protein [Alteromonas oceanisediminis]
MSLRTKTIVGVALIELILLVILIVTAIGFMTQIIDDTLTKRAKTTAELFATTTKDAVLSYDLASLDAFTSDLMSHPDIAYVRVIGQNGALFASGGDPALVNRTFVEDSQLADVTDGIFDTAAAIFEDEFVFGRVEVGLGIQSTQQAIATVRRWSLSIALVELVLVAAFSFILGSYLTRQLKALTAGSRRVRTALQRGNFKDSTIQVDVKSDDELSDLAKSFNRLVTALQHELAVNAQQRRDLTSMNLELEGKVRRRTQALSDKNAELSQANQHMKETQQQLLQAEKLASVGQLAAGVAHEINNPVGFIASNLSTLKDYVSAYQLLIHHAQLLANCDDDAAFDTTLAELRHIIEREDIEFIDQDVHALLNESSEGLRRVSEIVNGLKLFSRMDSQERQLFDINACLKTTLNMVNNELKYHCEIDTQFSDLPHLLINVGQLNQVFTNILINAGHAIKATGKFGQITINTATRGQNVVVAICDNGTGIPEEIRRDIFNPFFTTKAEGSGTGLGLSISIGIVTEHGGTLTVDSTLGKGSCFSVCLPISREEEAHK